MTLAECGGVTLRLASRLPAALSFVGVRVMIKEGARLAERL